MQTEEKKEICTAIVLAAGQGSRMKSSVQKQYLKLKERPVIFYTLHAFEVSGVIDNVVLVVGEGQEDYARREIVEKYGFQKVEAIVAGGKERYDSVWAGLRAIRDGEMKTAGEEGYIFIHDGARMFVDEDIIEKGWETVKKYQTAIAAMPSKDTVKLIDQDGFVVDTPRRKYVWTVQTPQIFEKNLIIEAYGKLMQRLGTENNADGMPDQKSEMQITDDAMVVEQMEKIPVRLFEASYENIKITTPEDLEVAERFLEKRQGLFF